MHTVVRDALPDDVAVLQDLEDEARRTVAERRGGARLLQERHPLGDGWNDALARVLVGAIDDVVVGYLVLSPIVAGAPALIEQVYVTPEAREIGFGDDLLAAAIDAARRGGAVAIEAEALPGDRETKNLYERAGVTARKLVLSKSLT